MSHRTEEEFRQHRFELPPEATDILLVRHGESEPARRGLEFPMRDGHADPALAETGREQAARVGSRLSVEPIHSIYVSPLRRTAQTAEPLAARLGLTPVVEPDLVEVHLGEWEGAAFRINIADRHPLAARVFTEQRWDVIPGAEPAVEFERRVWEVLARLAAAHRGQRIAVFSHAGFIGQALALATDSARFAFIGADNASISQLVLGATEGWLVRRYNDTAHLDPALRVRPAEALI